MKILHFQQQGVGVILSNRLNQLPGIKSRVLATSRHPFGFKADYVLPPVPRVAHWLLGMSRWGFDILHSHDGFPMPEYVLRRWKGRFIQHYHSPLAKDPYVDGMPIRCFVSTATQAIPGAEWLPLPVDLVRFYPIPKEKPTIAIGYSYNPSADPSKLKYIPAEALAKFAENNPNVELRPLTTSIPYDEMPTYYRSLDIYVDRIGLDWYGWQAAEAAACGAVIITQMLTKKVGLPRCPFVRVKDGEEDLVRALNYLVNSWVSREILQLFQMIAVVTPRRCMIQKR